MDIFKRFVIEPFGARIQINQDRTTGRNSFAHAISAALTFPETAVSAEAFEKTASTSLTIFARWAAERARKRLCQRDEVAALAQLPTESVVLISGARVWVDTDTAEHRCDGINRDFGMFSLPRSPTAGLTRQTPWPRQEAQPLHFLLIARRLRFPRTARRARAIAGARRRV